VQGLKKILKSGVRLSWLWEGIGTSDQRHMT